MGKRKSDITKLQNQIYDALDAATKLHLRVSVDAAAEADGKQTYATRLCAALVQVKRGLLAALDAAHGIDGIALDMMMDAQSGAPAEA